ncbi:MAG: hypothetical protein AAFO07_29320, partial [Bacteroidota bacterium]
MIKIGKHSLIAFNYSLLFLLLFSLLLACNEVETSNPVEPEFVSYGLHGYLGYRSKPDSTYGMGVSFYTAAWPLIDQPLKGFQIGLPGTWIIPNNKDNKTIALCPPGTTIRDYTDRDPTWEDVFQTLEGGLGYWQSTKYRYESAKFSMNSTPQCYDYEVANPGWSFFYDDNALADSLLGVAQLSNRLLIPPDALTFEGSPNGEFMGYAYMALPFTDAYHNSKVAIGNQSWTCFINTENFKGPIGYYTPETWTKMSEIYPEVEGRGLDTREGIINGGAMEINTVPSYRAYDADSTLYIKTPKLNFPIDASGKAPLVQDLKYYNKEALYNEILDWRTKQIASNGQFKDAGMLQPKMETTFSSLDISGVEIKELDNVLKTFADDNTFGYQWEETAFTNGSFPEYFKKEGDAMIPIEASKVPKQLGLLEAEFPLLENSGSY